MKITAAIVALAVTGIVPTFALEKRCAFLPEEIAPPITFELPASALSHPLIQLPIEFRGLAPIVTRTQLKHNEKPKVTIVRYSTTPSIYYDETKQSLVVAASVQCVDGAPSSGAKSYLSSFRNSGIIFGATTLLAALTTSSFSGTTGGLTSASTLWAMATVLVMAQIPSFASAHSDDCQPVVQVLVQAPSGYKGAVDVCMDEINDPIICPEPFPVFPTCNDASPVCPVVVIGAGAGGLYTALRMVDEGKIEASDVCVFEMTERVGGRLLSLRGLGDDGDLAVDAGGYRTWPRFTPTLHALITEYLGLPMECYDDSDPCQVYNIVDDAGKKAGFALFVEEMMKRLTDKGACFYPYHELRSFSKVDGAEFNTDHATELRFANGVTAVATNATILNIPQRPLLSIVRNSNLEEEGILNAETLDALHSVQTVIATKLYLYYPRGHVFWLKLGLRMGDFDSPGDARRMLLSGRYHDGQVECDDDSDLDTCHGFLLAVYNNDLSGNRAQFFRRYQRDRPEPVTIIAGNNLEGREFLRQAHDRLMNYHLYEKRDAPYTGFQAAAILRDIEPPKFAVLSTWNIAIPWAGGAWHAWTDLSNIHLAKQPFVKDNVFVVNEAFSLLQGWAEGSIKVADEILEQYFGIDRPWDFPVIDLNQIVRQTDSEECVIPSGGGTSSGGGGNGGGGGGGDDGLDALLCFTGDALVHMADGTLKPIRSVEVGDVVLTGTEYGHGIVTEKLVHPVNRDVSLATVNTEHGELIGTPDHPVLYKDEWIDLVELPHEKRVHLETRHVDYLYNLEIDGHEVESSSHSYVVNGIVASGLGDNETLNRIFARQTTWKDHVAKVSEVVVEQ